MGQKASEAFYPLSFWFGHNLDVDVVAIVTLQNKHDFLLAGRWSVCSEVMQAGFLPKGKCQQILFSSIVEII